MIDGMARRFSGFISFSLGTGGNIKQFSDRTYDTQCPSLFYIAQQNISS